MPIPKLIKFTCMIDTQTADRETTEEDTAKGIEFLLNWALQEAFKRNHGLANQKISTAQDSKAEFIEVY